MKIGFPVLAIAPKNEIQFDKNLHSSKYFGVYCCSSGLIKVIQTENVDENSHGMGIIHFLKGEKIEKIISPECYSMAAKFFSDNDIAVYKANGLNVMLNIACLDKGDLPLFTSESTIQNSRCADTCSSCEGTCDQIEQEVVSI